jgi:hypothetical protein
MSPTSDETTNFCISEISVNEILCIFLFFFYQKWSYKINKTMGGRIFCIPFFKSQLKTILDSKRNERNKIIVG